MRHVSQMTTDELSAELNAIGYFGTPRGDEIENELRLRFGVSAFADEVVQN